MRKHENQIEDLRAFRHALGFRPRRLYLRPALLRTKTDLLVFAVDHCWKSPHGNHCTYSIALARQSFCRCFPTLSAGYFIWNVGYVVIQRPAQKTFDARGEDPATDES
jgi:hypothetical protein